MAAVVISADSRAFIARNHMIDQLARHHERHIQQMWDMLDNDFDPSVLDHNTADAERITAELPDADDLEAWHDLHRRLGYVQHLGYEDRAFLARVRNDFGDALDAVGRASFDEATTRIEAAHKLLAWTAHERRREGSRPAVWLAPEHRRRLGELAEELAVAVARIRRARRAAS